MTAAERQARRYVRRQEQAARWRSALERILEASTVREARAIAAEALEEKPASE